jgi:hypothetical protein
MQQLWNKLPPAPKQKKKPQEGNLGADNNTNISVFF